MKIFQNVEYFKSNHTVYYVTEINRGISDNKVLDIALNLNAILITSDKDFGGLSFLKKRTKNGFDNFN